MQFSKLLENVVDEPLFVGEVKSLLKRKMDGDELDEGPTIPAIHEYIDRELARVSKLFVESQRPRLDMERLNTLYRSLLKS